MTLFFDKIEGMKRHWRTWYLLLRLRNKKFSAQAENEDFKYGEGQWMLHGKEFFLNEMSEKFLWFIPRPKGWARRQKNIDASILDELAKQTPPKVEVRTAQDIGAWKAGISLTINKDTEFIRTTGHGDAFADFSTAFVEFCDKNKLIAVAIWSIFIFSFWPILKPFALPTICEHVTVKEWC